MKIFNLLRKFEKNTKMEKKYKTTISRQHQDLGPPYQRPLPQSWVAHCAEFSTYNTMKSLYLGMCIDVHTLPLPSRYHSRGNTLPHSLLTNSPPLALGIGMSQCPVVAGLPSLRLWLYIMRGMWGSKSDQLFGPSGTRRNIKPSSMGPHCRWQNKFRGNGQ